MSHRLKQCPKCGELKPRTPVFFYRMTASPDGLQGYCKPCQREGVRASAARRRATPEGREARTRANYRYKLRTKPGYLDREAERDATARLIAMHRTEYAQYLDAARRDLADEAAERD